MFGVYSSKVITFIWKDFLFSDFFFYGSFWAFWAIFGVGVGLYVHKLTTFGFFVLSCSLSLWWLFPICIGKIHYSRDSVIMWFFSSLNYCSDGVFQDPLKLTLMPLWKLICQFFNQSLGKFGEITDVVNQVCRLFLLKVELEKQSILVFIDN